MSLNRALMQHQFSFVFPVLPIGGKTARAEESLAALLADLPLTRTPAVEDLQVGLQRVAQQIREQGGLAGLSRRDLKRMPWFLFEEMEDGRILAEDPQLVRQWGEWFADHPGSGTLSALLHNVLLHDPPESQKSFWNHLLRNHLQASRQPNLIAWKERCERFHLLEPEGAQFFAERLYRGEVTFLAACQEAGLVGDLARGGFVRKALHRLLTRLEGYAAPHGLQTEQLQTLLNGFRDQQGRFMQIVAGFTAQLAEVLLRPFQNREAETRLRNLLRDFLVKNLGDPRTHPAAWQAVDPQVRQVILNWLSGRPARIDDKLWMFVQEANKQLAELEVVLYQLKNQPKSVSMNVLQHAIQRLNAIMGVAGFFQLHEVVSLCQTMESLLLQIRDKTLAVTPERIEKLLLQHGRLQDAIRDVPGFAFHGQ
ncbi:MAG: Hpt domain-containing protein [Magnetococcales bacterium]|nr:Hpt domain-containing protein [Magnetococcales bacterium]